MFSLVSGLWGVGNSGRKTLHIKTRSTHQAPLVMPSHCLMGEAEMQTPKTLIQQLSKSAEHVQFDQSGLVRVECIDTTGMPPLAPTPKSYSVDSLNMSSKASSQESLATKQNRIIRFFVAVMARLR